MADGPRATIIEQVGLDAIWAGAATLLEAHYQELCNVKEVAVLKPDYARYKAAEDDDRFLALLARENGEVVGYSANFRTQSLHYADLQVYQNDVIYVAPECRRGRLGLALRRETIKHLRSRWGPGLMVWHVKQGTPMQHLLMRTGCRVLDVLLSEYV